MSRAESQSAVPKSKLCWYQMSKWSLLSLLLLASYAAWQAYEMRRYRQGIEAACVLTEKGAKVTWKSFGKDQAIAAEIDARGSELTDADLGYIINVMSPVGRLRLDGSRMTNEGVKKLRTALPECEIEWTGQPFPRGDSRYRSRIHPYEHCKEPALWQRGLAKPAGETIGLVAHLARRRSPKGHQTEELAVSTPV